MPDIVVTIDVQPDDTQLLLSVPLNSAQLPVAAFGAVLEISPDAGVTWYFAASSDCTPPQQPTGISGAATAAWSMGAASPSLPLPPKKARARLTNSNDPTLVPTLIAS